MYRASFTSTRSSLLLTVAGDLDLDDVDPRAPRAGELCSGMAQRAQQEQMPSFGPTERTGDRQPLTHLDRLVHLTARCDPEELVRQRHRRPDGALGVQADAVRPETRTVGEEA